MPDWLRATVWIVGVLALLLTVFVGYLMWRYRIPPRGLFAMGAAALYLISPIDLVPEAILGPLGADGGSVRTRRAGKRPSIPRCRCCVPAPRPRPGPTSTICGCLARHVP